MLVCLIGIAVAALAGLTKEREMPEAEKKKAIAEFNFTKGILVATFSGIMSACFAFALTAGNPIGEASTAAGTTVIWTGLPKLVVVLLGGFTTNFIWCVLLNLKNRTGYQYFDSAIRPEHRHGSADRHRNGHGRAGSGEVAVQTRRRRAGCIERAPMLQQLPLLRAGRHHLVLPVLLLHHGRDADGQVRLRQLDAAHGQHHHLQHHVGLDLPRMERLQQEGPPPHRHGIATLILSTIIIGFGTWLKGGQTLGDVVNMIFG